MKTFKENIIDTMATLDKYIDNGLIVKFQEVALKSVHTINNKTGIVGMSNGVVVFGIDLHVDTIEIYTSKTKKDPTPLTLSNFNEFLDWFAIYEKTTIIKGLKDDVNEACHRADAYEN